MIEDVFNSLARLSIPGILLNSSKAYSSCSQTQLAYLSLASLSSILHEYFSIHLSGINTESVRLLRLWQAHTHTHTHMCVYVCVHVCMCMYALMHLWVDP